MSEWPEHGAELARKSLEHLHEKGFENENGKLSDVALWLVADTIATITQGLIPAEHWETIYAVREELGAKFKKAKT